MKEKIIKTKKPESGVRRAFRDFWFIVAIVAGGIVAYFAGSIVGAIVLDIAQVPLSTLTPLQLQLTGYAVSHAIIFTLLISLAHVLRGGNLRQVFGLGRVTNWNYALLLPLVYVGCLIISGVVSLIILTLMPTFQIDQAQDLGLPSVAGTGDVLLTGILLVIFAPVAEEFIFRGYLFGMLRRHASFIGASVLVSILFGLAHEQPNVIVVTFILSLALCYIREKTGSIWVGMGLHALQNFVAFLLLYIYDIV